jgi:hypothetical protein
MYKDMKEFMFYIRNKKDAKESLTTEEHLEFIKKCEEYIRNLKAKDQLIAAQPMMREGYVISFTDKQWIRTDISSYMDVQVGYYHILANDLDEAIRIAMENPEFEYVPSASIEVRPVKTREIETGFVYPTEGRMEELTWKHDGQH